MSLIVLSRVPRSSDVEYGIEQVAVGRGVSTCRAVAEDSIGQAENEIGVNLAVVEEVVLEHAQVVETEPLDWNEDESHGDD